MTIEEELFNQYIIDKNKLIKYGFENKNDKLNYEAQISKYNFKILIEYNNKINAKIYDCETNEEYTNFRRETSNGFSSEIREEFVKILTDIRDKCSKKQLFQTKQALHINEYIAEKYHDKPEFLWANFPTYAIYRNKKSKKWYALIGTIAFNKVNKNSSSEKIVEIINVKIDKNRLNEHLNKKGVYEAFHMNKKSWVTIVLDNTLTDSEIAKFINESYKNV